MEQENIKQPEVNKSSSTEGSIEAKTEKDENQEDKALKECQSSLAEMKDNYLRVSADFQNYKKRLEKEQSALKRRMQSDILRDLLDIVDNFDRALQDDELNQEQSVQAWKEGFKLIQKELYKLLEKYGVSQIESYEEFNPELHEAVMQVHSDDHESGSIVEVLQKGYLIDGHVLRPAKVSIAH
jgi:molecular chaperone GrpE